VGKWTLFAGTRGVEFALRMYEQTTVPISAVRERPVIDNDEPSSYSKDIDLNPLLTCKASLDDDMNNGLLGDKMASTCIVPRIVVCQHQILQVQKKNKIPTNKAIATECVTSAAPPEKTRSYVERLRADTSVFHHRIFFVYFRV
jgi:hypothetical protein